MAAGSMCQGCITEAAEYNAEVFDFFADRIEEIIIAANKLREYVLHGRAKRKAGHRRTGENRRRVSYGRLCYE